MLKPDPGGVDKARRCYLYQGLVRGSRPGPASVYFQSEAIMTRMEFFDGVYDILVGDLGAYESQRPEFLECVRNIHIAEDWRFNGKGGFIFIYCPFRNLVTMSNGRARQEREMVVPVNERLKVREEHYEGELR
jgi:hypothetical protein